MANLTNEQVGRASAPGLDAILGQTFKVLDEGFVRAVDYMGSDASIVQAARVSYGAGTKSVSEDEALIRYLMRVAHTSPFEMCELKLHVRVPMDCWRQWIRHRTASVSEYSTRYSVAIDAAQVTAPGSWRSQATTNRQGSGEPLPLSLGDALSADELELHEHCRKVYERRLASGVAREQARKDLPLATYTEAYWKIDLHNLLHFLRLRMAPDAQYEIRQYANIIGHEIVARWCPFTWQAFLDYRLNAMSFSPQEACILGLLTEGRTTEATEEADRRGWLKRTAGNLLPHRERGEFEAKLGRLGLLVPWHPIPER